MVSGMGAGGESWSAKASFTPEDAHQRSGYRHHTPWRMEGLTKIS